MSGYSGSPVTEITDVAKVESGRDKVRWHRETLRPAQGKENRPYRTNHVRVMRAIFVLVANRNRKRRQLFLFFEIVVNQRKRRSP